MPELRLVIAVIVAIPNFVEVIHVELTHKGLVPIVAEVQGEKFSLKTLDVFNYECLAGFAPMDYF